jgi:hypothetical protein
MGKKAARANRPSEYTVELSYEDGRATLAVAELIDRLEGDTSDAAIRRAIAEAAADVASDGPWPGFRLRGEGELIEAIKEQLAAGAVEG